MGRLEIGSGSASEPLRVWGPPQERINMSVSYNFTNEIILYHPPPHCKLNIPLYRNVATCGLPYGDKINSNQVVFFLRHRRSFPRFINHKLLRFPSRNQPLFRPSYYLRNICNSSLWVTEVIVGCSIIHCHLTALSGKE